MPTRATSLQNSTLTGLTREVGSKYDEIKLVADNIDAIEAVADAMAAGVDFEDIAAVTVDVNTLKLAMDGKVDKETGKTLTSNDFSNAYKSKVDGIKTGATKNSTDAHLLDRTNHTGTQSLDTTTDGVDRLAMTTAERAKLKGIANGANAYVHPAKHPISIIDTQGNQNKFVKTDALGNIGFDVVSWSDVQGKPSGYTPAAHTHDMLDVVSGSLSATRVTTTTDRNFVTATDLSNLSKVVTTDSKGVPNGYAPLDATGKINSSYISDIATIEVFTPVDEASMLALVSANPGDIAYRQDTQNTYMLVALPSNVLANWKQLNTGANVLSVNGLTGVVSLSTSNIPEDANLYYTDARADARVQALAYTKTQVQTALPKVGFDLAAAQTVVKGQLAWNATERTLDLGLGSDVVLQVGQEQLIGVQNNTGSTITNLTVCMYAGSIGNSGNFRVAPFSGTDVKKLVGVATEDIPNGAVGFVTTFGKIRGVDTRAWSVGAILYLGSNGNLTSTVPTSGLKVAIAVVISSNIHGTIFVRANTADENAYEPANANIQEHIVDTNNPHNVTASQLGLGDYTRADKYLAAQNIANMTYVSGDLAKIQYNTATDVDYETLGYTSGNLTSINHYVGSVLKGTTTLSYTAGNLTSAVFVGV